MHSLAGDTHTWVGSGCFDAVGVAAVSATCWAIVSTTGFAGWYLSGPGGGGTSDKDVNDQEDRRQSLPEDAALRAIVEGVEAETGDEFFASLVRHLTSALHVQYAFVSEI